MSFFKRMRNAYFDGSYDADRQAEQHSGTYLIDEKSPSPMAIIYRSEIDYISRCVLDYPNIETGGQLFGFWTNQGVPVVLYAIGPGLNANHQVTFFNQDTEYLTSVGNALLKNYALQHIGEWHSHHQLGLARPSGHDAQTMFHGLQNIPARHLLLCICNYEQGKSVINPYTFHENDMHNYVDARWKIKELESPFRPIADHELQYILIHPQTENAAHGQLRLIDDLRRPTPIPDGAVRFSKDYWLLRPGNIENMKKMASYVQQHYPEKEVKIQADSNGIAQITIGEEETAFIFPENFPNEAPQYSCADNKVYAPLWITPDNEENIPESFRQWLDTLIGAPADNTAPDAGTDDSPQAADEPEDTTQNDNEPNIQTQNIESL